MVRATGTEQWFFALGTLAEVVGIGWPAVGVKDEDKDVVGVFPRRSRLRMLGISWNICLLQEFGHQSRVSMRL